MLIDISNHTQRTSCHCLLSGNQFRPHI